MDFTRLFDILEYQQQRFPQKIALAGQENGAWRTWSTAEALAERDRISAGLLARDFQKGDRVGILIQRSLDLVPAALAAWRVGALYVPRDEQRRAAVQGKLAGVIASLGKSGAPERAAEAILSLLP